jgi:internalin A
MADPDGALPRAEAAFREAEARIAEWPPGEPLDLAIVGLERIPDSIGDLTALQYLDLHVTQVSDLGPLSGLTALQNLDLRDTQVSDLGPLSDVTALQSLDCGFTEVSDLGPLAGLTALKRLDCDFTKVSDLAPLSGVTTLQRLDCGFTKVSDLGPLSSLTALQSLDCRGTTVSDLGPLSGLTALQNLSIYSTQVSDLGPLSGLTALQRLNFSRCRIPTFPDGLFDRPTLETVTCHGGTLGDIPAEVLSQGWRENCLPSIRAHLRDLETGAERMRDAKMLVLGNGRVGKTQLCRRLLGEPFEDNADSTHGIVVRPLTITAPDGEPARLQLWDFGGQDIYHSTHTLFMRSRGMYLVAWTPEQEDNETHTWNGQIFRNHTLPYWLAQVAAFAGPKSPVMVVQTQADTLQDRRSLDAAAREKVKTFQTWFEIHHSASTGRGQDDLTEAMAECYATIEQPAIGVVRARVKRTLEDRIAARTQRTMTMADFRALCDDQGGVADPALFLETLDNSGTVFCHPELLGDYIILDQAWAIQAIYAIFERDGSNYAIITSNRGRFSRTLLGQTLWDRNYTAEEQALFLSMMESCGICFENRPGDEDAGLEAEYIAPDLLPERLSGGMWDGTDAEQTRDCRYALLPSALIRRVISAIGQRARTQGDYWRHGVRLNDDRTKSEGLITSDEAGGTLALRTRHGDAADLLATLAEIVAQEEDRLGLKPTDVTGSLNDPACRADPPADTGSPVDRLTAKRPPRAEPAWFFSYARDSEKALGNPVAAFCDTVKHKTGITVRRDTEELGYGEAIDDFVRELTEGDRIFIWLTDAYLKSPWCMVELHGIWRTCLEDPATFEQRVTIILGDACLRHHTDLKRYRDFWRRQQDAAYDRLKIAKHSHDAAIDLARITEIVNTTDDILIFIRDRIRYESIEEMQTKEFPDV